MVRAAGLLIIAASAASLAVSQAWAEGSARPQAGADWAKRAAQGAAGEDAPPRAAPPRAADPGNGTPKASQAQKGLIVISPIFSELVVFSLPSRFVTAFENTRGASYIREAVPKGETVDAWSEMITVTGTKDMAKEPDVTPAAFFERVASGYARACPQSFSSKTIAQTAIAGKDAVIAVASCGSVAGKDHSEAAVFTVIKGARDFYSVQWAKRGAAGPRVEIDDQTWLTLLAQLGTIKVCEIVRGEKPPYPSCIARK